VFWDVGWLQKAPSSLRCQRGESEETHKLEKILYMEYRKRQGESRGAKVKHFLVNVAATLLLNAIILQVKWTGVDESTWVAEDQLDGYEETVSEFLSGQSAAA